MTNPTPPPPSHPTFHLLDVVPSTHTLACDLARSHAPHGEALLARSQTAGRGRMGRTWCSPPDLHHLYLSVITRFPWPLPELAKLPLLAGLWMAETIHHETNGAARVSLKWPNDLIIQGRKLGGILCECLTPDDPTLPHIPAVIVSVGLNLGGTSADLDPDLRPHAITLAEVLSFSGKSLAITDAFRVQVARTFLSKLLPQPLPTSPPNTLLDQWLAWSCLPSRVRLEDGSEGTATSLEPSGALRVELLHGGVSSVHAGELHWIELTAQYRP